MVKDTPKKLNLRLTNPHSDDSGFIEDCLAKGDRKSILIFLLDSLPTTTIKINRFRGCVEIYPNMPDVADQTGESTIELDSDDD